MNPILIVDDEAAIAMLVRRILTEAGYRCQAVTDSRAAANLLEKNRYDLVLLDVMMPHLDGYDLLAYLRPTGTPCIFITAKDAVAERVRGLNSGADDYIVKPFAPLNWWPGWKACCGAPGAAPPSIRCGSIRWTLRPAVCCAVRRKCT